MKMKNLFDKFFKKEPQFNYTIAEYLPSKIKAPIRDLGITEFDINEIEERDEMEIDNIYQEL